MMTRKQLAELGANLAAAMGSDGEYNAQATALEADVFNSIIDTYRDDEAEFRDSAYESACHAGLDVDGVSLLHDWIAGCLFKPDGTLNVQYLWELTGEAYDDMGNPLPCPVKRG